MPPLRLCLLLSCLVVHLTRADDCFDYGIDYSGYDLDEGHYTSTDGPAACQGVCQSNPSCQYWTWDSSYHNACWLKSNKGATAQNPSLTSGPKYCDDDPVTPDPGDGSSVKVLSYNMYGWNALIQNPWKAENMYKHIRAASPDLLGAQEVENLAYQVADNIGSDYEVAGSSAGHGILYKSSVMHFEDYGQENIHEQDQWGPRTVEFAHFTHTSGKKVDHFNTHLCVCSEGDLLKSARTLADVIQRHRRPGSKVVLTGDFNVFGGFENSQAIRYLTGQLESSPVVLKDTFRAVYPSGDGTTFPGAGKIDYVLVETATTVTGAYIDRENYGEASDHLPIVGTFAV